MPFDGKFWIPPASVHLSVCIGTTEQENRNSIHSSGEKISYGHCKKCYRHNIIDIGHPHSFNPCKKISLTLYQLYNNYLLPIVGI